ncbi:MAG: serine hydrolase domain-containing protein, partial [Gemmatimonadaceae bacterium]
APLLLIAAAGFSLEPAATHAPVQQRSAPGVADTARGDPRFDAIRSRLANAVASDSLVSIAVAVAQGGKIVWEEAFGWADRERKVRATPQTTYSLASITKPMTATAIMVLAERGTVRLDAPANQYLGSGKLRAFRGNADSATVRHLLVHTSGLPTHYQFFYADEAAKPPSMDETIRRYGILVNTPGAVPQYSNLGFGILDHIIERASGRSYADFMRDEVFRPLGLTRTAVVVNPAGARGTAIRYGARGEPLPFYDFDHRGASAVYASVHDLVSFGMFFLKDRVPGQRRILSDSTIDAMYREGNFHGYRSRYFAGGMPGVSTSLLLLPSEDIAVAVVANTRSPLPARTMGDVVGVLLPDVAAKLAARQSQSRGEPTPVVPFTPGPQLVGEWSGTLRTWNDSLPFRLVVPPEGDARLQLAGRPEMPLSRARFNDGTLTGRFAGSVPTPDVSRQPHEIALDLTLRGDTLSGVVAAVATADRIHFLLPSWVSLIRR